MPWTVTPSPPRLHAFVTRVPGGCGGGGEGGGGKGGGGSGGGGSGGER